ncbi:hypothetical protein E2R56_11560 [Rhodococcus qingshengii]|nr:hypothetical protein E2R56_11560 [Rhodococcus qingshengii]
MNRSKNTSIVLQILTILVLVSTILSVNVSTARADAQEWEGCWKSGEYSLYIGLFGDTLKGKIRHGNIGREDPQEIYDTKLTGNTLTGKWKSDPTYTDDASKGVVRRGIFEITLVSKNRIEGQARETEASDINKGTDWPWNFERQTDTSMCKAAKDALD